MSHLQFLSKFLDLRMADAELCDRPTFPSGGFSRLSLRSCTPRLFAMLPLGAMEVYVLSRPDTGLMDKEGSRLVRLSAGEPTPLLEESRGRTDRHNCTVGPGKPVQGLLRALSVHFMCVHSHMGGASSWCLTTNIQ